MNRNHPASPGPDRLRRGLLSLLLGGLPAFAGSGLAFLLGGGVLGCSGASPDHCVLHADCPADEACLAGRCTPGCRRDDQCGAGQSCDAQARCVPAGEGEGEGEGLGEGEGEGEPDGGPPEDAGEQPDGGGSGLCRSELDGRVTRAEFTLGPGIGAPFVTLTPADRRVLIPVDLAGTPGPTAGRRVWTFDDPPATNRQPEYVQAWSPAAVPAGRHFPDATYVVRLSGEADLLAFFQLTADALLLLGLADPAAATTLLVYTPAVVALRFPVVPGESWETTATATGTLLGAQVEVVDRYQTHVLVAGDLQLDLGRLPVVQLATLLTRTFPAAGFSQSTTTVQFLGECGGFYATAVGPATGERLPAGVRQLQLLGSPLCRSAADCGAGGRCSASGLCQPDGIAPAGVAPACTANGDGVIADDEFVARPGLAALYLASPPDEAVAVDLAGAPAGGAAQSWDLRSAAFGSTEVVESLLDPTESWYASSFPEATYASLLDRSSGTLAVFRREPGRLLLLGLASQQRDLTLLVYEEPVEAFRFPLRVGDRWSAETRTTGTLGGFPTSLTIRYHFTVDAAGTVRLPAGDVPVLRQRLESVQQVEGAAYAISRRTVLFVAECLGAVARVLSPINEPAEDFSPATEVVRLTVPRCFGDLQCPDGTRCEQGRCLDREGRPWGEGTEGEGEEGEGEGTEGEGEGTEGEGEGAEGEGAEGEGAEGEGAEGEGAEGGGRG